MITVQLMSARVSARTRWQVVRLRDGDGALGLGEYSDTGPHADRLWPAVAARLADGVSLSEVLAALDRHLRALASGGRSTTPGVLTAPDHPAPRTGPAPGDPGPDRAERAAGAERHAVLTVRGALEQASTDLAARRAGRPLWQWLGGSGARPVRRYANLNRALRRRTPEEFGEVAAAAFRAGYTALKCAPFDWLSSEERVRGGLARARAARRAAPRAELMIDVHHHLTVDQIIDSTAALRALDLRWLEDAVRLDDPAGLAAVHAARIAPLAGGEFAAAPEEVRPALRAGHLSWLLPDVKHAGGLEAARRLAEEAARAGAGVSLHNPAGPVATAAGLHLAAVLGPAVETEFAFGEAAWRAACVHPAESPDGPWLTPPDGPGLGLDLSPGHWTVHHPHALSGEGAPR